MWILAPTKPTDGQIERLQIIRGLSQGVLDRTVSEQAIHELIDNGSPMLLSWLIDSLRDGCEDDPLPIERITCSINSIRERFGDEIAVRETLSGFATAHQKRALADKHWHSALSFQMHAGPTTLLQFAEDHPRSIQLAIAYVVSSEQFLTLHAASTIRALNVYPRLAALIGPSVAGFLEDVDFESPNGRELLELGMCSKVTCIRQVAAQLLQRAN